MKPLERAAPELVLVDRKCICHTLGRECVGDSLREILRTCEISARLSFVCEQLQLVGMVQWQFIK
jgi:hypothetical protein